MKLVAVVFLLLSFGGGLIIEKSYASPFICKERKKRNDKKWKEAADDPPSWVKREGHKPCKNPKEDGKAFAKRLLDGKYGAGNYKTGGASEYSQIQKYGEHAFD